MRQPTKDDLIKDLVKINDLSDKRALTFEEYKDEGGKYSKSQFSNRFGSWTEAKKKAGVPRVNPNSRKDVKLEVTRDMVIEDLQKVAEDGKLRQDDYREDGKHSVRTFYKHFDNWEDGLEEAGLEKVGRELKITEEELKEELREGKSLTQIADEYGYSSLNTLSQRIRRYDWDVKNKLSMPSDPGNNAVILSLKQKDLGEAKVDTEKQLYYDKEISDGKVVLNISEDRISE